MAPESGCSPMDAGGGERFLGEEAGQKVRIALGLHKHENAVSTCARDGRESDAKQLPQASQALVGVS